MIVTEPLLLVGHDIDEARSTRPDGSTEWRYFATVELAPKEPAFEVLGMSAAAEPGDFSFTEVPKGLVRVVGERIHVTDLDLAPWGNRIPAAWLATVEREPPAWERWWAGESP